MLLLPVFGLVRKLILYAFRVGKEIAVAADKDFTNQYKLIGCDVKGDIYTYRFETGDKDIPKTVFIQSPVLYVPREIVPTYVPFAEGSIAKRNTEKDGSSTDAKDWFSIRSIDVEEYTTGTYLVRILADINAETVDFPRMPKLIAGEKQIGGLSVLHFNNDSSSEIGEFQYLVDATTEDAVTELLETASLRVQSVFTRAELKETKDINTLPVIWRKGA